MTAAETGHLVFSTLHTNSAPQTIDRILDTFPADQQGQIRAQLAQVLRAVISMKLVVRKDGKGRVAALEIMRNSPKIAKMIEKGETSELHEELESSVGYYRMQSMNQSLLALLVYGAITYQEAMEQSHDPEDLLLKLRRMFPNLEQRGDRSRDARRGFRRDSGAAPVPQALRRPGSEEQGADRRKDEHAPTFRAPSRTARTPSASSKAASRRCAPKSRRCAADYAQPAGRGRRKR